MIATDAPAAAPRLMAASGDRSNGTLPTSKTSSAITRIDRNSGNMQIYAYVIKQSVSKNFLLLRTTPRLTALRTVYFSAITRNGFCFHILKIISRRPLPHRKTEIYIFWSFFVFSIYSTKIDIITNNFFFLFLNRGPMCISGMPADCIDLHVSFYPGRRLTARFCM